MTSVYRSRDIRGVFLDRMVINGPQHEIMITMQLATKQERVDPVTHEKTESLADSKVVTAISRDRGKTFRMGPVETDIDGDGDIDAKDTAKLAALAKAYNSILNP
ncbi:hypothetical protein JFT91_06335 [Pseudomonas sp. TH08]|nr:hypothetical protein [Pseudomonas sp. TH06]MBK5526506.1 hypothetical protein [Pseudomonas sp. TH06]MBK5532228.1 hypothetical protein [Pseudomonas sp. TH08]